MSYYTLQRNLKSSKMKRTLLFLGQALVVLCLVFMVGCKDKEDEKQPPTCSIINPTNNAEFEAGEIVLVSVVANATNSVITEVQLYVDNVGHSSASTFPYNFTINAGELPIGTHTLKAVAVTDKGLKGESSSVTIKINPANTESPDFVTFSEGKVPNTWQITGWVIDNTIGYDDTYSLRATSIGATSITRKTCSSNINFVEFYLRGNGTVDFYIDAVKAKTCDLTNSWIKHDFYLEDGFHTLTWQFTNGVEVNLDAIQFKKETQLKLGMYYQGGIIFYLDNTNAHGFIAASEDQSIAAQWSNDYITIGTTGTSVGTGKSNTTKIVQKLGSNIVYAAKICDDLVISSYNDWFLPSIDELDILFQNRNLVGGFNASNIGSKAYWSSSEKEYNTACGQNFSTGTQSYNYYKNALLCVRAIRSF